MPLLAAELLRIVFGTVAGTLLVELLRASGRRQEPTQPPISGEEIMNELEIIGALYDEDDDDIGAIGADEDLLEALTVSGDGGTELIGADFIGARPRVRDASSARRKAALRKLAMRNAGAVVKRNLRRRRRFPIGLVPTNVAAGATVLIPAAPQNLFRPERFVIPSDIAFDFGVVNINVGNTSQLVQAVEVPGAMFSEVAVDTNITFDTAEVGNQLSAQVRNKAAIVIEFTAAFLGTVAKP